MFYVTHQSFMPNVNESCHLVHCFILCVNIHYYIFLTVLISRQTGTLNYSLHLYIGPSKCIVCMSFEFPYLILLHIFLGGLNTILLQQNIVFRSDNFTLTYKIELIIIS